MCPTTLKRICRQHGIIRWPSRKINKVNRSLRKIQSVLDSVHGMEGAFKFDTSMGGLVTAGSIIQEVEPGRSDGSPKPDAGLLIRGSLLKNTQSSDISSCMDIKTTTVKQECSIDGNNVVEDFKSSTLHLHNPQKSQSAALDVRLSWPANLDNAPSTNMSTSPPSNERNNIWAFDGNRRDLKASDSHFVYQDANLHHDIVINIDNGVSEHNQPTSSGMTDSSNGSLTGSMMNGSSSSSKSFGKGQKDKETSIADSGSKITVKATYREDTVRFKFKPSCGCLQLYEEVSKRFKLQIGLFQLKYLDDEEEWVMLVNDLDLQECLEVLEFSGTCSAKLLVHDVAIVVGAQVAATASWEMALEC